MTVKEMGPVRRAPSPALLSFANIVGAPAKRVARVSRPEDPIHPGGAQSVNAIPGFNSSRMPGQHAALATMESNSVIVTVHEQLARPYLLGGVHDLNSRRHDRKLRSRVGKSFPVWRPVIRNASSTFRSLV